MSELKMPEPAGYQYRNKKTGRASVVRSQMDMSLRGGEDYTEQRLFTESQMRAYALEATRQAMEHCRRLVLHEVLHLEDVNCDEDVAYNAAINDAQNAIAREIALLAPQEKS